MCRTTLRTAALAIVVVAACGGKKSEHAAGSAGSAAGSVAAGDGDEGPCSLVKFATSTPVPEASGAAWWTLKGKPALVVISDSGNAGAYGVVDPETGETIEQGKLPLASADDDLEGVAVRSDRLHVLTSPGWVRAYQRTDTDDGFKLIDGPYALGPIDIDDKGGGMGDTAPQGTGLVCNADAVNCGRNYEGLCLAPDPTATRCVGFAASKADGHLYCISEGNARLHVEYEGRIQIAREGVLGDCAFAPDGTLYVGSNLFDANAVYRVTGWQEPATAKVEKLSSLGLGFAETIAAGRDGVIYRMSDTGKAPSLMTKHRCR